MSEATEESRTGREIPLSLLVLMFFASGAAGLIYETLWSRHLQLVFGSTTEAVSVVLATFMTGLGIGSYLFAARSGHTRRSGTSTRSIASPRRPGARVGRSRSDPARSSAAHVCRRRHAEGAIDAGTASRSRLAGRAHAPGRSRGGEESASGCRGRAAQ